MNRPVDHNSDQYISIPDYARELGVSRITVYNRVKSGQIPARKVGRNYVILWVQTTGAPSQDVLSQTQSSEYISIADLAKQLGISRIAVYQRIKAGKIKATKAGRNYIISAQDIPSKPKTKKKELLTDVKQYISVPELAKKLGVSRVDVWQKVMSGKIKAEKIGRNYVVDTQSIYSDMKPSQFKSKQLANEYISIPALAREMNVSRITIFNKVKRGEIKAQKIGRNYVICKKDLEGSTHA